MAAIKLIPVITARLKGQMEAYDWSVLTGLATPESILSSPLRQSSVFILALKLMS